MNSAGRSISLPLVLLALIYPGLFTWLYYDLLQTAPMAWQQAAFVLGKSLQLLLPVIALWGVSKASAGTAHGTLRSARQAALLFGAIVALGAVALLSPIGPMPEIREAFGGRLAERLSGFGLEGPLAFAALGLGYSLVHSLFEEYYWRSFVYRGLRERCSATSAALLSSAGFAVHHAVLLGVLLGTGEPLVWLLAVAVATGGFVWARLYEKTASLRWPWISHALVDAGLFAGAGLLLYWS